MNRSTVKYGSKGEDVKYLQKLLGIPADGIAGKQTQNAIIEFQKKSGLTADGICGAKTWAALEKINNSVTVEPGDLYVNHYLKTGQYVAGNYPKDLIVLHHTAGWNSPYQTVDVWGYDSQRVCTEFVIGGLRCTNGDNTYDGKIVHSYPTGAYGYHIGKAGVSGIDKRSVGIELCAFGHITKDGKTYTGALCQPEQICHLDQPFRGYSDYHQYSDRQLESLRKLMLFIADRDNIDLHTGLYQWIKSQGVKAFDFQSDAYYGKVKNGVVTHANIRKDKEDVFPQPELIDMILSL